MANHTINDPPIFTDGIRKLETTDPQHADTFNGPFGGLINNDVWLKKQIEGKEGTIKDVAETAIADGDGIPFVDVSASNSTKRLTFASLKATLKSYFDTLYNKYVHPTHTARTNGLYKIVVDTLGHVTGATTVSKADITALGIPSQDTVYRHPSYTARNAGMYKVTVDSTGHVSAVAAIVKGDITALGIPAQDTIYTHPSSHPASMITQDSARRFITDTERTTWNGKASTAVATTTANGLMAAADKTKLNGISAGATKYVHPAYTARPSGLYKVTVDGTGHVSGTAAVSKADLGALGAASTASYTATISTTWGGSAAPYTQVVTVSGLLTTDKQVHITPNYSATLATAQAQQEAWNLVSKGDVTANNQITFTCFGDKPVTAVPVKLEVTR